MIIGIGIDSVDINRFANWHSKPKNSLKRILSEEEINYCLETTTLSAQRFAARFAAREALFKAIQPLFIKKMPFLTLCSASTLVKSLDGSVSVTVNWQQLASYVHYLESEIFYIHISVTHTQSAATAVIVLEKR